MYDKEKRKDLSRMTVGDMIKLFNELPNDAMVVCSGSSRFYLHVGRNQVCLDTDTLDDCYPSNAYPPKKIIGGATI
ncbi:MAG: hypothetical protein NC311_06555 [Muribaculaceae bacterium]|nr:hypothetical protein [Ruminococcus flavefaciens]MCM1295184.1 hypothetical protein [Muribaculaceae bacterium]